MPDYGKVKRNVAKMVSMNAPEADIDAYISSEGVTIDDIRNYKEQSLPAVPQTPGAGVVAGVKKAGTQFSNYSPNTPESGHWGAGIINTANTAFDVSGFPFEAANQALPMMRNINPLSEPVMDLVNLIGRGVGWAGQKISDAMLPGDNKINSLGFISPLLGGLTPESMQFTIPEQYKPEYEALQGAVSRGASAVAASTLPYAPKAAAATVRGASRILPNPEWLYNVASKGDVLSPAERSATSFGVENRMPVGANYRNAPKVLEKYNSEIKTAVDTKLTPEIQKIEAAGEIPSRLDFAKQARAELTQGNNALGSPTGERFSATLDQLEKDYLARGEKIKPSEMQREKQSTYKEAPYDKESTIAKEYDKTIARLYRQWLEDRSPRIKQINQELQNKIILRDRFVNNVEKTGKSLPTGETSLPFYIAVTHSPAGVGASILRQMMGGRPLAQAAFGIDALRTVGKPRVVQPTAPGYEPTAPSYTPPESPVSGGGEPFTPRPPDPRVHETARPPATPEVAQIREAMKSLGLRPAGESMGMAYFHYGPDTWSIPINGFTIDKLIQKVKMQSGQ